MCGRRVASIRDGSGRIRWILFPCGRRHNSPWNVRTAVLPGRRTAWFFDKGRMTMSTWVPPARGGGVVQCHATVCNAMQPGATPCNRVQPISRRAKNEPTDVGGGRKPRPEAFRWSRLVSKSAGGGACNAMQRYATPCNRVQPNRRMRKTKPPPPIANLRQRESGSDAGKRELDNEFDLAKERRLVKVQLLADLREARPMGVG